jgi:hypothetical protein
MLLSLNLTLVYGLSLELGFAQGALFKGKKAIGNNAVKYGTRGGRVKMHQW